MHAPMRWSTWHAIAQKAARYALAASAASKAARQRWTSSGVSAKFAGSGGAIIGICSDEETLERLQESMREIKCEVIRPIMR